MALIALENTNNFRYALGRKTPWRGRTQLSQSDSTCSMMSGKVSSCHWI